MKTSAFPPRIASLIGLVAMCILSANASASLSTSKWYYQGRLVGASQTTIIGNGGQSLTLADSSGTVYATYPVYSTWKAIACLPLDATNVPACIVKSGNSAWEYLEAYHYNGSKLLTFTNRLQLWGVANIYKGSATKAVVWLESNSQTEGGLLGFYNGANRKIALSSMPGGYFNWDWDWVPRLPERRYATGFSFSNMTTHYAVNVSFNVPNPSYNSAGIGPLGIYRYNNGAWSWYR